ncbi:MAG: electron transport complex subunit RsxD [bacterium]
MHFNTPTSPHTPLPNNVSNIMLMVILALLPGIAALFWYFGWGVLINVVIATITAVTAEALFLKARGRAVMPALSDLSAVVTAILLAISLPPILPWWMVVLGTAFAIIVVKQLYGGIGYNPFNPAMAGYVLLLVSFPVAMTRWLPPEVLATHPMSLLDSMQLIFAGTLPAGESWDTITSATPLDEMREQLGRNQMISEIAQSPLWGNYGGLGWEWVGNWFLLGGIFLIWRKVISWHIPVAMILSTLFFAGLFWLFDPETKPFPAFHLFSGGFILGAFFIATDPVSAATTRKGQLIYGALIGFMVYVIRTWGGYPDAVAFAVLLMNAAAPTIDYYSKPRAFGQSEDRSP